MIKKDLRLKIHNFNNQINNIQEMQEKNKKVIQIIFMGILRQVMIFIKSIQILHHSNQIIKAPRKINIHLGEIFMGHTLVIKINGSKLIMIRNSNKDNKIKNKNKDKRMKEKSRGMGDILRKRKIFSGNIIMVITSILNNKQEIKMLKMDSIGMIGNQNLLRILKTQKILIKNLYLTNTNLENLRKKKKKNIKNMNLEKTQISMSKTEVHMQGQIYSVKDGNLG
jgi:hypothetical protein